MAWIYDLNRTWCGLERPRPAKDEFLKPGERSSLYTKQGYGGAKSAFTIFLHSPLVESVAIWPQSPTPKGAVGNSSMLQSLPTTTVAPQAAVDRFEAIARKTVVAPLQNVQTGSAEAAAARTQLSASLAVTRTADTMMGRLLDTKA